MDELITFLALVAGLLYAAIVIAWTMVLPAVGLLWCLGWLS